MITELAKSQMFTVKLSGHTLIGAEALQSAEQATNKTSNHLEPGSAVDQKYKILRLLGEGGMGAVYQAQHLQLGKDVALKTFSSQIYSEDSQKRFLREAQSLAKLEHRNVVNVFDYGWQDNKTPYYTMEYLVGQSMAEKIASGQSMTVDQVIAIFIEIASGLAYVHGKNLIHRDLKPGNIFLTADGAKIVDFGIVSTLDQNKDQKLTGTGDDIILGSPLYMSPEQANGQKIDKRTDIYSFGCTLYECLTGSPPFVGKTALQTLLKHQNEKPLSLQEMSGGRFSPQLELLIKRLLAKKPEERSLDFEEVEASLKRCLQAPAAATKTRGHRNNNNSSNRADEIPEESNAKFSSLPTKAIFVSGAAILMAFACIAISIVQKQKPVPRAQPKETSLPLAKISESEMQGNHDFAPPEINRQVLSNGQEVIQIKFPHKPFMGMLALMPEGKDFPADGVYQWQASTPLAFKPSYQFCNAPENFKTLKGLNIISLDLTEAKEISSSAALLKELALSIPNLQVLVMPEGNLRDENIGLLDNLPNLKRLSIPGCEVTGDGVAKIRQLKELQLLDISFNKNPLPAINKLAGGKLYKLVLGHVKLAAEDYRAIAKLESVKELTVVGSHLTDDDLKILADGSIKLKWLHAQDSLLSKNSFPTFVAMKKKGLITLLIGSSNLSAQDRVDLVKLLSPMHSIEVKSEESLDKAIQKLSNDTFK